MRLLKLVKRFVESKYETPTVKELAKEFSVHPRTVFRDLSALEEAGFRFGNDAEGRRVIAPEVREEIITPPLRSDQAMALLWAARVVGRRGLFTRELHIASRTLGILATDRGYLASAVLNYALVVNQSGLRKGHADSGVLLDLLTAIAENRRCKIQHDASERPQTSTVLFEPYRILAAAGGIYCLGVNPGVDKVTAVPIETISSAEITSESFLPPLREQMDKRQQEAFGIEWERPMKVIVRFRADCAAEIADHVWHPSQQIVTLPNGDVELHMRAGGEIEIIRWILSWGPAAEVLKPIRLRKAIAARLHAAASCYGKTDKEVGPTRIEPVRL